MVEEFEFVKSMPKGEKKLWQRVREHIDEIKRITDKRGIPVPQKLAANLLNVSQQRIDQLLKEGRLELVLVGGHPFVTEDSIVEYAQTERKQGRPTKMESLDVKGVWKAANAMARGKYLVKGK